MFHFRRRLPFHKLLGIETSPLMNWERGALTTKRSTIVSLLIGLAIVTLLAMGPLFKRSRINHAVAELLSPDAQKLGNVPSAVTYLETIGLNDKKVESALLGALTDDEARRHYWGGRPDVVASKVPRLFDLLVGVGEPAVPPLIQLLRDEDRRVRGIAADTLERMGVAAEPAIPALMAAANDPELRKNRYNDVNKPMDALIKLGQSAVPSLVQSLKSTDEDIRLQAVEALLLMGPEAEAAAPDLVQLLVHQPDVIEDPDDALVVTPADVLVQIGTPTIPALKNALSHPDDAVRHRVERVLRTIEQATTNEAGPHEDD